MTLTAKQGDCGLSRSEILIGEDVMVILRNNIFICMQLPLCNKCASFFTNVLES